MAVIKAAWVLGSLTKAVALLTVSDTVPVTVTCVKTAAPDPIVVMGLAVDPTGVAAEVAVGATVVAGTTAMLIVGAEKLVICTPKEVAIGSCNATKFAVTALAKAVAFVCIN